ncbi:MAG: LysM peptidoglycan-binding domain-containing protein [Candidatus Adiutrix sp.]|jgi:LysM repeat protein|nr:LysM peptidoglycan-binding domain-containing protein [Candidatus Adiutrix sp.]
MKKLCLMAVLLTATGCFNSESDYERLLEEKESYADQLAAAQQENEILRQSLANVTAEQERLQTLLDMEKSRLAASALPLRTENGNPADGEDIWVEAPVRQAGQTPAAAQEPPRREPPAEPAPAPRPAPTGTRTYTVKPGDILYGIASRNNTTVNAILELNPKIRERRNNMIHEGEKLQLP